MADMVVRLEACEPMELMRNPTPSKVWFRLLPASYHWPEVEIRGDQDQIHKFVSVNWGEEIADEAVYGR